MSTMTDDRQMPFLFAPSARIVQIHHRGSIEERFAAFIAANPHVVKVIIDIARTMRGDAKKRIGMKACYEIARWEYVRATRDHSGFKLNNDYTALFARYIAATVPELADAFEFRERRTR